MPKRRKDAEYLRQRIRDLYRSHTARQVATILNNDPNILSPVNEHIVYNTLQHMRAMPTHDDFEQTPWSVEEDSFLKQWHAVGASVRMIAQQLRRTDTSVHRRILSLELPRCGLTPKQVEVVQSMLRVTKKSPCEISEELGVSYRSVLRIKNQFTTVGSANRAE